MISNRQDLKVNIPLNLTVIPFRTELSVKTMFFTIKFYYWIDSNKQSTNINFISLILSIFLLHWIKAIYIYCSSKFNYVVIYPAKLLSRDIPINTKTKINSHGNIYRPQINNIC